MSYLPGRIPWSSCGGVSSLPEKDSLESIVSVIGVIMNIYSCYVSSLPGGTPWSPAIRTGRMSADPPARNDNNNDNNKHNDNDRYEQRLW